jgi:hypothetical protein
MAEPAPRTIQGLELWLPGQSFHQDHNRLPVRDAMPDFQTLMILAKPDEPAIYCTGKEGQVIYHTVDEETVNVRAIALEEEPGTVTSALDAGREISEQELEEEARLRELNLGLGRTSLFLAALAEDSRDFMRAAHDLQQILEMLDQPVHTMDSLTATTMSDRGLMYMFVQAARKFKTLSEENATELSHAIGRSVMPFPTTKSGRNIETWAAHREHAFIERVGFPQPKLIQRSKGGPRRRSESHVIHKEETLGEQKKRTPAEIFIYRLLGDRTHNPYEVKLARAHHAYFEEEPQDFEVRNDTRTDMARLGFRAYLAENSRRGNDAAGQILEYLSRRGGNPHRPLLPLIVVGNLVTSKLNAGGGVKGRQLELPGLAPENLAQGFQALRAMFETSGSSRQGKEIKMLGDIVSGYLEAAFPPGEGYESPLSYNTPPAPEDYVSTVDFAQQYDLSHDILERVLPDYGVDAATYRFDKFARKGLSPEDQEKLIDALDELRIARAPRGSRSVTTFANLIGTSGKKINELIEEHSIEAPTRRFTTKLGRSLSPEDQKTLARLLGREERFRPYDTLERQKQQSS